jgi:hypothetical protein
LDGSFDNDALSIGATTIAPVASSVSTTTVPSVSSLMV